MRDAPLWRADRRPRLNFAATKFDAAGTIQWTAYFGTGGTDRNHIAVDAAGNIYVVGFYSGTVDFSLDPNNPYYLTSAGSDDIFLLKLNQS